MNFYNEDLKHLQKLLGESSIERYLKVKDRNQPCIIYRSDLFSYNYVTECLNTMEEAGNNKWWLSEDKRTIAFYQLRANVMLVSPNVFYDALEELFGRKIEPSDVAHNRKSLIDEAIRKYYSNNISKVDDYISEAQKKG